MKYDFVIVGAGLTGATFARVATDRSKHCLVVDRRSHIGGNCYTEERNSMHMHVYGPHIFHTSDEMVWRFITRFASFNSFVNRPKVIAGDRIFSFPLNMMTFHQLWGVMTPDEARQEIFERSEPYRIRFPDPQNMEEYALGKVGLEIYERFIRGYTMKQWHRQPDELPPFILKRIPIRYTWEDNYYIDKYQGIPLLGYTRIFEGLLEGSDVLLGTDYLSDRVRFESMAPRIVYTGRLDELHGHVLGSLDFRSLRFEHRDELGDVQGNAIMNYANVDIPWTRQVEHKHFNPDVCYPRTVITREFSDTCHVGSEPYYPINDRTNDALQSRYITLCDKQYIIAGRLGQYQYFDMDDAIKSALQLAAEHI